jgi:hypothetical protein
MFPVRQLPDLELIARRWIYKDLIGFNVKKKETFARLDTSLKDLVLS